MRRIEYGACDRPDTKQASAAFLKTTAKRFFKERSKKLFTALRGFPTPPSRAHDEFQQAAAD
jgi:hypothetical protein